MKKPLIINLFGAPGSGKSTGAAYIFSQLKLQGINAELVTEFAKEKTWEQNQKALDDQIYILGESYHKLFICKDQVDVIVTDCPLLTEILFIKDKSIKKPLISLIKKLYNQFDNINFFLNRVKAYNPKGRNQTEEESNNLKYKLLKILNGVDETNYIEINGSEEGYNLALRLIEKKLLERGILHG